MKGTYHISQNATMLSFDLKGENSTFEHTFKLKNDNVAYLLSNMLHKHATANLFNGKFYRHRNGH